MKMTGTQQFRANPGKIAYVKRKKAHQNHRSGGWPPLSARFKMLVKTSDRFVSEKQICAGETQITQWDLTLTDPSHDKEVNLRR